MVERDKDTEDSLVDRATREETLRIVRALASADGSNATSLPFLSILAATRPSPTRSGILEPSLCYVAQGGKRLEIGREIYTYGAGSYVVSAIESPTAGQITRASRSEPYLAIRIALDATEIASVILDAKLDLAPRRASERPGVFVATSDAPLRASILSLLRLTSDADDAAFLAAAAKREIIYRLLKSSHGPVIHRVVKPKSLGVVKAIAWVRRHFAEPITIDALAKTSRMSVSSLRHEFKATTAMGPLQFQKQLRLQEARRLLMAGEVDAGGAAFRVGYESPSQFSREYRRLFGAPPMRDVHKSSEKPVVVAL
jgi:AraC-like DNA-binding protein